MHFTDEFEQLDEAIRDYDIRGIAAATYEGMPGIVEGLGDGINQSIAVKTSNLLRHSEILSICIKEGILDQDLAKNILIGYFHDLHEFAKYEINRVQKNDSGRWATFTCIWEKWKPFYDKEQNLNPDSNNNTDNKIGDSPISTAS